MKIVHDAAREAGLRFAESIFPLAEGVQKWATREQADNAQAIWSDRFIRRMADIGSPVRVWMPDYELKAEGADVMREWMRGNIKPSLNTARYMQGAAAALAELDAAGKVPNGAGLVWYGLSWLEGVFGYMSHQLALAKQLLTLGAWAVCPSFKIRRRIGEGISAHHQRARTRIAAQQLIETLGSPDLVIPEISCTEYGSESFEAVPERDIAEAFAGMVEAGCTQCMVYGQAESEPVARVVAEHMRVFGAGVKAAEAQPQAR